MREFFQGWRRKAGCVLLLMAAASMGGWLRSSAICDWLMIRSQQNHIEILGSNSATLMYWSRADEGPAPSFYVTQPAFTDGSIESVVKQHYWHWGPFHVGDGELELTGASVAFVVIPYWSVTIPLAVLSAYLILWPGKRPERQATPPPEATTNSR